MAADVHAHGTPSRSSDTRQTRLPWWAVALPCLAFCALLALIVTGGEVDAARHGGEPLVRLLAEIQRALT